MVQRAPFPGSPVATGGGGGCLSSQTWDCSHRRGSKVGWAWGRGGWGGSGVGLPLLEELEPE